MAIREIIREKRSGFDRTTEKFLELDLDKWLTENKVKEQGRNLGISNQPTSDAKGLDATENQIVDWINLRGNDCRQDVSNHLSDLAQNIISHENEEELNILESEIPIIEQEGLNAIETSATKGRQELIPTWNEVADVRRNFEKFRKSAGLTRRADYTHRRNALLTIFVFFAIEVVLNATLLMDVNVFGLAGSTIQMGLISAVNVLIAGVTMGALLRQARHVKWVRKFFSSIAIFLVVLFIGVFNLAIGHFRDAMAAKADAPLIDILSMGNDTIQRLLSDPLALASFQSGLLALLGVLFFGIASWKWLQRDDPYPDYGRRDREIRKLSKSYIASYDQAKAVLDKALDNTNSQLRDILHKLQIQKSHWKETCARGEKIVENYQINMAQYQHDLDYLLSIYRDENRIARTEPAPPHFEEKVFLNQDLLIAPSFNPPPATRLEKISKVIHGAMASLQDAQTKATTKFPTLDILESDLIQFEGSETVE